MKRLAFVRYRPLNKLPTPDTAKEHTGCSGIFEVCPYSVTSADINFKVLTVIEDKLLEPSCVEISQNGVVLLNEFSITLA